MDTSLKYWTEARKGLFIIVLSRWQDTEELIELQPFTRLAAIDFSIAIFVAGLAFPEQQAYLLDANYRKNFPPPCRPELQAIFS